MSARMMHQGDVLELVRQRMPASLLCVGPEGVLFRPYVQESAGRRLEEVTEADPLAQIGSIGAVDFAYLSGTLERLDKREATLLLARLRDLYARFIAVYLQGDGGGWTEADFFSLGFVRHRHYPTTPPSGLYTFDRERYKQTPEWLNPRDWAHPERWDKAWW